MTGFQNTKSQAPQTSKKWWERSLQEQVALVESWEAKREDRERQRRRQELEMLTTKVADGNGEPLRNTPLARAKPGGCPTCGFPPGCPGFVIYDFPVGHPQFGKPQPCPDCHDGNLVVRLREGSQLTGQLLEKTLENYQIRKDKKNQEALNAATAFAQNPQGWLTLWSTFGAGKTHLLAAIVNHCTAARIAAVYYTLPDLLDALRESYNDSYSALMEKLTRVRVLVIDEVDKVKLSEWAQEKIYQLVDARYRGLNHLGTAFAMNTDPRPAVNHTGNNGNSGLGYLYSRMADHRSRVVHVGGGDVRPIKL